MKIYTRTGDDGTTGLLYGGRVPKDSDVIAANGAVDEAQAALGVVRAEVEKGSELDALLIGLERDLYVLMAEVATAPSNRRKLTAGVSLVTGEMVSALEQRIDDLSGRFPPIKDFVIPGHDRVSAGLDVARTATRRAERAALKVFPPMPAEASGPDGSPAAAAPSSVEPGPSGVPEAAGGDQLERSHVVRYLNRLSDLLWTMARWQESGDSLLSRKATPTR